MTPVKQIQLTDSPISKINFYSHSESQRMADTDWNVTVQTSTRDYERNGQLTTGCLVRIHPLELENKMVRLTLNKTTLGREPSNDIFCDDTSISRNHASIVKTREGFFLEDRNSTNGTFVDGQRVSNHQLTDGCKIQVGNHIFKFLAGDSIESQYHETVYSMMTKDGLTNVYNKRFLIESVSREFERSQAYGRPFSLVIMDIDYFKKFNDKYGHLAGDEVLQEFAQRIDEECNCNKTFARFGGEEFVVLLIETSTEQAQEFSESIRQKICDTPFECCAGAIDVSASFGIAEFNKDKHKNFAELIDEADQNLYQAKANGRNQVNAG